MYLLGPNKPNLTNGLFGHFGKIAKIKFLIRFYSITISSPAEESIEGAFDASSGHRPQGQRSTD